MPAPTVHSGIRSPALPAAAARAASGQAAEKGDELAPLTIHNVSGQPIGLAPKWLLRHPTFLGAVYPAKKCEPARLCASAVPQNRAPRWPHGEERPAILLPNGAAAVMCL